MIFFFVCNNGFSFLQINIYYNETRKKINSNEIIQFLIKNVQFEKEKRKNRKKVKMFRNETGLETVAVQNLEDHENQM